MYDDIKKSFLLCTVLFLARESQFMHVPIPQRLSPILFEEKSVWLMPKNSVGCGLFASFVQRIRSPPLYL